MKDISTMARTVLGYFVEPTEDAPRHIDAEFFSEELVELLFAGYLRLEGTLASATLHVTPQGIEYFILKGRTS